MKLLGRIKQTGDPVPGFLGRFGLYIQWPSDGLYWSYDESVKSLRGGYLFPFLICFAVEPPKEK